MRINITPQAVYEFVNNISKDPNPIHREKNPVIPGDLLVSLYLITKGLQYGEFSFNSIRKAPVEIEIRDGGIYHNNKKIISYQLYHMIPYKMLESYDIAWEEVNSNEKLNEVIRFFNKHFDNIFDTYYPKRPHRESVARLIFAYTLLTNKIASYINEKYKNVSLAVYTRHSFVSTLEHKDSNDITYVIEENKEKRIALIRAFMPYNPDIIISKEVKLKYK